MQHTIFCLKLKQELPALPYQPYPGLLGKKIVENISAQAWREWMAHQTMLINENRLNLISPESRSFLEAEMEKYFFGEGSSAPEGYVPLDEVKK
jgi:Fe-S cluster biosynthesis and repair protein YggX